MNGNAAAVRGAVKRRPSGRFALLSRRIHRIVALFAALLMLWLAGTGSSIQVLDLHALLTHVPAEDPQQLSMVEGMFGPPNFAVLEVRDFGAADLPASLDFQRAVATVLHAAHPDAGAASNWVELRQLDGRTVGQVMTDGMLSAFDAVTGAPLPASPATSIPQGGRLPHSLRQKLKTLHRFWNRGDTPGVYFELLSGLVLLTLLITALVMYFSLLQARTRLGKRQWFWSAGGRWRAWHRGASVIAAAFLLCIAASGTWIGFESTYNALGRTRGGPPPRTAERTVPDAQLVAMAATAVQAMRRGHPDLPIRVLRLRAFGTMPQGVFINGGDPVRQWVFDARNGQPVSLTEPEYPKSGFPLGVQVHEDVKHFHSGAMFGLPTRMMSLLCGLSVIFLAVSGLVMYVDLWRARRKGGRGSLLWL